jgi:hypothetical protein
MQHCFRAFDAHHPVGGLPPVGDRRNSGRDTEHLRRPRDHHDVHRPGIFVTGQHGRSLLLHLFELLFVGRDTVREFRPGTVRVDRKVHPSRRPRLSGRLGDLSIDHRGL